MNPSPRYHIQTTPNRAGLQVVFKKRKWSFQSGEKRMLGYLLCNPIGLTVDSTIHVQNKKRRRRRCHETKCTIKCIIFK